MNIPDNELAKGCAQGKEEYCKILFERYYGKMLNVCKRYAGDQDEAKDMLQDGLIRVFKSLHQFEGKGSLEGWIRRVVVTSAINYCKKYKMNGSLVHIDPADFYDEDRKEDSYTLNYAAEKMDAEKLLRIIQDLPPVYRTVFNLFAIEGYAHEEIAKLLGISEGTSRSNLAKARRKLQEIVEKETLTKKNSHGELAK